MLDPARKTQFEKGPIGQRIGAGFENAGQRLIQIVFRKQIGLDRVRSNSQDQVLNRYRLIVKQQVTKSEIASIAANLYKNDYGHPLTEGKGVYWTLE